MTNSSDTDIRIKRGLTAQPQENTLYRTNILWYQWQIKTLMSDKCHISTDKYPVNENLYFISKLLPYHLAGYQKMLPAPPLSQTWQGGISQDFLYDTIWWTQQHGFIYPIMVTWWLHWQPRVIVMPTLVITSSTTGCCNNNLWCCQWWQSWHRDNTWMSGEGKQSAIQDFHFGIFHPYPAQDNLWWVNIW